MSGQPILPIVLDCVEDLVDQVVTAPDWPARADAYARLEEAVPIGDRPLWLACVRHRDRGPLGSLIAHLVKTGEHGPGEIVRDPKPWLPHPKRVRWDR